MVLLLNGIFSSCTLSRSAAGPHGPHSNTDNTEKWKSEWPTESFFLHWNHCKLALILTFFTMKNPRKLHGQEQPWGRAGETIGLFSSFRWHCLYRLQVDLGRFVFPLKILVTCPFHHDGCLVSTMPRCGSVFLSFANESVIVAFHSHRIPSKSCTAGTPPHCKVLNCGGGGMLLLSILLLHVYMCVRRQ